MSPGRGQSWLAHQAVALTSWLLHRSRRDCAPCPALLFRTGAGPVASSRSPAVHRSKLRVPSSLPFHGQRRRRDRSGGRCGRCRRRQPRRTHPARRDAGHRYPRLQPHPVRTLAPVDVFTKEDITSVESTDLKDVLAQLVPSFVVQRLPMADGQVFVRPATLRGLSPDQTLVLVNGRRFHRSALLGNRGAQAADLAQIPTSAIKRIEVLRDGASAQYGSDAIAGVINIILEDGPGTEITAGYSQYAQGDGASRDSVRAPAGRWATTAAWCCSPNCPTPTPPRARASARTRSPSRLHIRSWTCPIRCSAGASRNWKPPRRLQREGQCQRDAGALCLRPVQPQRWRQ